MARPVHVATGVVSVHGLKDVITVEVLEKILKDRVQLVVSTRTRRRERDAELGALVELFKNLKTCYWRWR